MGFIVTIILIYFAIRFSFWLLGHVLMHKTNKSAEKADYQTNEEDHGKQKRKKIFQKETGEYVDFEEIDQK